mgnify:CR=1 FL=1
MHSTDGWNLLYISFKKLAFLILALCAFSTVEAQKAKGNYNFLSFEQKPYYFGITLGSNNSTFRVFRSDQFVLNDSIRIIEDVRGPGFNLGIVSNLKIGNYFDFRFLPTLSFTEKTISYTPTERRENPRTRKLEQVLVQMPFHIRYKSAPFNDVRLFVVAGVKFDFDVANENRTRQASELVKIASSDFSGEFGVGMQIFFPYFIFSPEIKISQGLGNTLIYDNELLESNVIEKVLSRTFTLSFHFEG